MAFTPAPIADLRRYLSEQTGREPKYFSIARDCRTGSCAGYHLGKDQMYGPGGMGDKDYSNQRSRDKAGLTNARSAIDINLSVKNLKPLRAYLVAEAKAGRATDVVEIIGPGDDGRAYAWSKSTWAPAGPRPRGDSHEWHIHVSFHRDSETRDKIALFRGYFEPTKPEPPPPAAPTVADLLVEIKRIESSGRQYSQDPRSGASGFYGFMPKNWIITASRVLGLNEADGVAGLGIPPEQWYPPMTVENQERVALSEAKRLSRRFDGDLRKIAASWSWGEGNVAKTPIPEWPRKPVVYSNNAVVPLGLDPLPVPDKPDPEPEPEPEPEDPAVTPEQVKALQTFLNTLGAKLAVDGVYGPATDAAVQAAGGAVAALRAEVTTHAAKIEAAKAALS